MSAPPPDYAPDALAFDPLPCARRDGWTAERQRDFIGQLARLGIVGAAAGAVGMSRKSAYALRHRAGEDSGFARAWDAALAEGCSHALDLSIERTVEGEQVPIYRRGKLVGHRVRHDNRLLFAALRALKPRAGAPSKEGVGKASG